MTCLYILLIIFALIFLLTTIILLTPVKLIISLKKDSDKALFRYRITVAGISVVSNEDNSGKIKKKYNQDKSSDKKKLKITDAIDIYNEFSDKITELIHYAANNSVEFKKIYFSLLFGTGDAALTGVTYGAISGIVYSLLGIIDAKCGIKDRCVEISPDFYSLTFNLDSECIVRIKNVHIIVIAFRFLILMFKVRKKYSDN